MRWFIIILAAMVILCPTKDKHRQAISDCIDEKVSQLDNDSKGAMAMLELLGSSAGVTRNDVIKFCSFKDYFIFSCGKCTLGVKTFGVFGIVLAIEEEGPMTRIVDSLLSSSGWHAAIKDIGVC